MGLVPLDSAWKTASDRVELIFKTMHSGTKMSGTKTATKNIPMQNKPIPVETKLYQSSSSIHTIPTPTPTHPDIPQSLNPQPQTHVLFTHWIFKIPSTAQPSSPPPPIPHHHQHPISTTQHPTPTHPNINLV